MLEQDAKSHDLSELFAFEKVRNHVISCHAPFFNNGSRVAPRFYKRATT